MSKEFLKRAVFKEFLQRAVDCKLDYQINDQGGFNRFRLQNGTK